MKRLRIIVAVLLCILSFQAFCTAADKGKCVKVRNLNESALVFKGGEQLSFAIHYKWGVINADVAKFSTRLDTTVFNGRKVFHASMSGATQKFYSSFFTVDEKLDSWFTRDGLVPLKFTRKAQEGNYTCTNLYSYIWNTGNTHIKASLNNSRKGDYYADIPLDKCTFDIPAMFYFMRNMDVSSLTVGGRYPMTFAVDDDVYTLHFIYYGKEEKKISGLGVVKTLKFGFQVVAGDVFSEGSDLYAWFSDDANKIPLLFVAPLKIGQVQGRLVSAKGLKHDFSSLVK
ncbi:MAG: DUF3108 domain-containing protein [Bacteroidales bacterium]|nr:DUF3108 domain-containing protein [Bacteroidales bacterium]